MQVLRGIVQGTTMKASTLLNISAGTTHRSYIEGTMMTVNPQDIDPPLVGMVEKVYSSRSDTRIELTPGIFAGQNEFFPAGDLKAGQALQGILQNEVRRYLKVMDPYISPATLTVLEYAPRGTEVRLICHTAYDVEMLRGENQRLSAVGLPIDVRRGTKAELHGRYLISDGMGLIIDHSLMDWGRKDCSIGRVMQNLTSLESIFDRRWAAAVAL